MKSIPSFRDKYIYSLTLVFVAAAALAGCGNNRGGAPLAGPEGEETTSGTRLAKVAVPQEKARAGVSVLVLDFADGRPVAGAEVAFSRSISGQRADYRWTETTDADGIAQLEVTADSPQSWGTGASGYYIAKVTDPETGEILGTWSSLPIHGGKEHVISLPIGAQSTVVSGSGSLDYTGLGLQAWSGPISGLPGSLESHFVVVIHRNINGEVWGLVTGYQDLKDVNPRTRELVPGLVLTFPVVGKYLCWELTGEGDSFQYKWEITKFPIAALVGVQSIGRVLDPGGAEQEQIAYVGAASVAEGEFESLECGDDFLPLIAGAVDAGTAIEYNLGGTFRIVRNSN